MHLNPRSGRWNPGRERPAHHIGIAIAYNVWQYYQVTGDLAYLIDYGAEMLLEIARFWASLADYDEHRGRYAIRGVIGPDEFHSGYPDAPHDGVDNNAYTNVMAVWVILRAFEALDAAAPAEPADLLDRLGLRGDELARWDDVSRRMFVPSTTASSASSRATANWPNWTGHGYRQRYGDIQRLDRILEAEGDDVNRYKASKQADVLMLFYLLSSDELREVLDRLGYQLDPRGDPAAWSTTTSPAPPTGRRCRPVVHAWVLARANRDGRSTSSNRCCARMSPTSRAAPPPRASTSRRWPAASTCCSAVSPDSRYAANA